MEYKDFEQTRKSWGDKPCNHPSTVKETHAYMGCSTGEYICTQCGRFADDDYKQNEECNQWGNQSK